MGEESTTATRKSPGIPSCMSQCGISEWCARGAGGRAAPWSIKLIQI